MDRKCYVKSAALVSCQAPLSDEWMDSPCRFEASYVRAQEPNSKEFIVPSEARRMSKILKRTVCTAITALNKAGISDPAAIITGTGMGCMETSEKFLIDMAKFGEHSLKPSLFMQSTHNTIGSLIGIVLKSHGYNNTYSHQAISFESALLDGWVQLRLGMIRNALVGSHDEITPLMALVVMRTHPEYKLISEVSMSAVLSSEPKDALCEVTHVEILHDASPEEIADILSPERDGLLLLGVNGNELNDAPYRELLGKLPFYPLCLAYKPVFSDNFSASAAGFYAAVRILEHRSIPRALYPGEVPDEAPAVTYITMINCSNGSTWGIVRLKKVELCGN